MSRLARLLAWALGCLVLLVAASARAATRQDEQAAAHLLRRWAPTFVQHVARDDGGLDRPTRIDFDGDWIMDNNWRHAAQLGTAVSSYVYGAAVLTETQAYLSYYLYYPRDWTRPICIPQVCHENDFEAILVVVNRDGTPDGALGLVETKAHFSYHDANDGREVLDVNGHPLAKVEDMGHGIRPCTAGDAECVAGERTFLYTVGDRPGITPAEPQGQRVAYQLLSIHDTLWQHRAPVESMWGGDVPVYYATGGERVGAPLGSMMQGRRYGPAARAPWGLAPAGFGRGDWFLDPARVILARHDLRGSALPGAHRYAYNPYVDELRAECEGSTCAPAPPPTRSVADGVGVCVALTALGLGKWRGRRRLLAALRRGAARWSVR